MCSVLLQGPTSECSKPPPRTVGGVQETQRSQLQTIRIALLPSALVGTLHVPNCTRVPKKPIKKKRSTVEPTNAHHTKRNTPPMIGGIATGPTEPQEPTDLLPKKFPKTSCIPILKAPNDDSFVVAEDLNEFMLIFSVPLCISLMGPRAVRETEGQGLGAEVPWRRTKKPHRWAFRRSRGGGMRRALPGGAPARFGGDQRGPKI